MSRTLTPCGTLPGPGKTLTFPFPDIAKPVPGGWQVTVSLRSTTSPPSETMMQVQQRGKVIASTRFTPTTSFADYSLTVSNGALALRDGDLGDLTEGVCVIVGLVVVISDSLYECCDPPVLLPATIHATISASGTAAPIDGMELDIPIVGSVTIPVCNLLTFTISTDQTHPPCDPLYLAGVDASFTSDGHFAGGIHTSLACAFFQGTPMGIGTIELQRDCNGIMIPGYEPCCSVVYSL